ncbi:hypothetical protein GALMADRAFT_133612 [Galerina marginata CBS 339.88]|uniref:Uncharacterized protein n=1 Tax=Galerina marginata (strain CBS 339.88) TaxID=685588 RepID=A0A067TPL0_GALM3|nr:hypothetical protein GALMADRAFT_133612 [Galerina marginata CBS 339.88]
MRQSVDQGSRHRKKVGKKPEESALKNKRKHHKLRHIGDGYFHNGFGRVKSSALQTTIEMEGNFPPRALNGSSPHPPRSSVLQRGLPESGSVAYANEITGEIPFCRMATPSPSTTDTDPSHSLSSTEFLQGGSGTIPYQVVHGPTQGPEESTPNNQGFFVHPRQWQDAPRYHENTHFAQEHWPVVPSTSGAMEQYPYPTPLPPTIYGPWHDSSSAPEPNSNYAYLPQGSSTYSTVEFNSDPSHSMQAPYFASYAPTSTAPFQQPTNSGFYTQDRSDPQI